MYSVFAGPGKKGFFSPFVWVILFLVCATISLPVGGAPLEVIKQYVENQKTSQRK